jgi:hypothetical protein
MSITGNETCSKKGIRLILGEIEGKEIILKQNIVKKRRIAPLKACKNIRKVENIKNSNLRMLA